MRWKLGLMHFCTWLFWVSLCIKIFISVFFWQFIPKDTKPNHKIVFKSVTSQKGLKNSTTKACLKRLNVHKIGLLLLSVFTWHPFSPAYLVQGVQACLGEWVVSTHKLRERIVVIGIRYTHNYNLNTKLKGTRFEWVEFLDFTRHPVLWSVCVEEPAEFQSGACLNACSSRTTCFAAGMAAAIAKRSRFNVTHHHGESWKTCTEIFFTFAFASRTCCCWKKEKKLKP